MQKWQHQNTQRLVVALLGVLSRGVVRCCSARLLFAQPFKWLALTQVPTCAQLHRNVYVVAVLVGCSAEQTTTAA